MRILKDLKTVFVTVLLNLSAGFVCLFFCSTNKHATFFSPSQAVSPDGEAIVTGAGDETLRFWNVFSKTRCTKVE